jgi:aminopeptidase
MYTPSQEILKKYAEVMVRYALNAGKGIKPGETVWIAAQECSKPLFTEVYKAVLRAGGHPTPHFLPDDFDRYFLNRNLVELGNDDQLKYFNQPYWEGIVNGHDHLLFIIATPDLKALEGLDSKKVSMVNARMKPFMDRRKIKQRTKDQFWTLCLYGTESAAAEAGMTLEEYWEEIIKACYLNEADPVAKWKSIQEQIEKTKDKLNALNIKKIHVKGENIDLFVSIGEKRQWLGGSGHNIPSFEIFVSPDWRETEGVIGFNQPLYNDGKRISGIRLQFEAGRIINATATENQDALLAMIAHKNADAVGQSADAGHGPLQRR